MPTREETYRRAEKILTDTLAIYGRAPENAWLAIYSALLWHENIDGEALPHIIDSNRLRRTQGANVWRARALKFEEFLAQKLKCPKEELPNRLDRLMRSPGFEGQRQNPLGTAFIGLTKFALEQFGDSSIQYRAEFPATDLFPTIALPGRSAAPKIDIAGFREEQLVTIISCKWSIRHDRLGDIISECRAYKAAGMWSRKFKYYVLTNEFDGARLTKVLQDECPDGVVHVCKTAVVDICGIDGRLKELLDMSDFLHLSKNW